MIKKLMKLRKNLIVVNTGWMLIEKVVQMIISLIVGMITARYLGPTNYGLINYIAAFISFATPICNLGMEAVLIRKIIDNPDNEGKYIGTSIMMEFIVSIISANIIVFLVYLSDTEDTIKAIVAALESIVLLAKSTEPIEYYFQSKLKSKYTSLIKIFGYVAMSIYKILLVFFKKSIEWFAFSTSLDMIVIAILYMIAYKIKGGKKLSFDISIGKNILCDSYHFIISGLIVVLYTQMDKIMIGNMLNTNQVGLYTAATTICTYWGFIPAAIINSFRPIIYETKKNNGDYISKLKLLYCIIFWMGIIVCILIMVFSKYIILLLYGKDFLAAKSTLNIAVWYTVFAYLGTARGIWIVCENKNKYAKKYILIGAIFNFCLNILLIPYFGINGAATATLLTQIMVAIIAPLFYNETRISTKYMIEAILFKGVGIYDNKQIKKE